MDATFQNLRLSTVTGEQNYIKANPLFFAVGVQVGYSKNPGIFRQLVCAYFHFPTASLTIPFPTTCMRTHAGRRRALCGDSFGQAWAD